MNVEREKMTNCSGEEREKKRRSEAERGLGVRAVFQHDYVIKKQ